MINLRRTTKLHKLRNVSGFNVKENETIEGLIQQTLKNVKNFGRSDETVVSPKMETVVVEFSSPNIAKPFHIGHLRSTIVGNFVANLFEKYAKCHVIRLNYLGDWGIQFGFLKVGLDLLYRNESNAKVFDVNNPMKSLHEAYVFANKLAENDVTIKNKAQEIFHSMENETNTDLMAEWKQFQEITVNYLTKTYARLGIYFDKYDFESFYASQKINNLKNDLKKVLYEEQKFQFANKEVIVLKKDGTSLYLTRDLAAAIDRFERYQFDRMFYVVSDQQLFHFKVLFELLKQLNHKWANGLTHVVFGNVSGMSSRKGKGVFLHDILDELSLRMYQKQISTKTTKISESNKKTADILAVSCMIVDSLRHKRVKHIEFEWEKALKTKDDSAVKLQYTHCRLHSILKNNNLSAAEQVDVEFFISSVHRDIIIELIESLAKFPEILNKCYIELEAKYLVKYLFSLCNKLNNVINNVNIKQMESEEAKRQALLLFESGRFILKSAMEILGLQVLNEM